MRWRNPRPDPEAPDGLVEVLRHRIVARLAEHPRDDQAAGAFGDMVNGAIAAQEAERGWRTQARVDAAARVVWETERSPDNHWDDADDEQRAAYRHIARKALAAADAA